jgi:putative ABC transport system permease protein
LPRLLEAVRSTTGVEAALITSGNGPFRGGYSTFPLRVIGRPQPTTDAAASLRISRVSPGFFEILRVPIVRGRSFSAQDKPGAMPAVVINDSAARQFWPGADPIGDRIEIEKVPWEIVGVAADMRYTDPTEAPMPSAFMHYEQSPLHGGGTLLLRTIGDRATVISAVKTAVWSLNPEQTLIELQTVDAQYARMTAARRFNMTVMSIFASLALVIAATGIYGVIAFLVGRRTKEIGVRIALGARRSEVVALFVRQGMAAVVAGIAAGLLGAWLLARSVQAFLFEVEPRDPMVFAIVAVTLALIGAMASWLPARRAARVDPVSALRAE